MPANWPAWITWLFFLATIATTIMVWLVFRQVGAVQLALASAGLAGGGRPAQSRKELEEKYVAGSITRDVYDRWKDRLR